MTAASSDLSWQRSSFPSSSERIRAGRRTLAGQRAHRLLRRCSPGRLQVRKRPSSGDPPRVEILSACPAQGNDVAELIPVELLARNRQSSDPARKGTGRALATGSAPACGNAALPTLRSVHSVEAEPLAADLECVAVERASRTADHPLRGGARLANGRERTATSRTSPTRIGPIPRACPDLPLLRRQEGR